MFPARNVVYSVFLNSASFFSMRSAFSGVMSQWKRRRGKARSSMREARVRLMKPEADSSPARTSLERETPSTAETYTSAYASSLSIFTSVT